MLELVRTTPSETAMTLASLAFEKAEMPIDGAITEQLLRIMRDSLATILGGSCLSEVKGLAAMVAELGVGQSTVIGSSARALPHVAALVNGTAGAALEVCEGNQYASNHPADHILPALFALAEDRGSSGAEFLQAFFAGYEIAVRVGRASRIRDAVHPFGTAMIVGTAVACARLQSFDLLETAQAIEVAAGLSIASSQNAANSGASVRNLFTGTTNHNGLLATKYVRAGFCGEPGALETVFGTILGERFSLDEGALDEGPYVMKNYFKIHACSRWNHAPIEAAEMILSDHDVNHEDIESITIFTFNPATRLNRNQVPNAYAAKHSIPFNVVARILHGSNAPRIYTEKTVRDPLLVDLMARTYVAEDRALTAQHPQIRAARVEILLKSGFTLSATCDRARGGFDNPLGDDELRAKFMELATMALSSERADALFEAIGRVATAPDMAEISACLCA